MQFSWKTASAPTGHFSVHTVPPGMSDFWTRPGAGNFLLVCVVLFFAMLRYSLSAAHKLTENYRRQDWALKKFYAGMGLAVCSISISETQQHSTDNMLQTAKPIPAPGDLPKSEIPGGTVCTEKWPHGAGPVFRENCTFWHFWHFCSFFTKVKKRS